ncbi:MAG: flagellar basal body P-ring protein FlgI, partial [Candidatus Hydrogenedentota bacterium]
DSARSRFTIQSVLAMLGKFGIRLDQQTLDPKNLAAVIVTVQVPPFISAGQKLDITVSSIGDAESLEGGVLLQTPLVGADGKVYAVAQGQISLGGGASLSSGAAGARTAESHKTTARIPNGAIVENSIASDMIDADGSLTWVLKRPDFATASRLADAVNAAFRPPLARAENAERVKVILPANYRDNPVPFIAKIEDILLQPDAVAKIIINERTGTIVFGENARISTVAISHGELSLSIKSTTAANAGTGGGATAATEQTIEEQPENTVTLPEGTNVRELVRALNAVGATPKDIIAVLQAIASAGALHAELEFI